MHQFIDIHMQNPDMFIYICIDAILTNCVSTVPSN